MNDCSIGSPTGFRFPFVILIATLGWLSLVANIADAAPPAEAEILTGTRSHFRPMFRFQPGFSRLEAQFSTRGHAGFINGVPLDAKGAEYNPSRITSMDVRASIRYDSKVSYRYLRIVADFEYDLVRTAFAANQDVESDHLPHDTGAEHSLRKASTRLSFGRYFHALGGVTTSRWGLGLMANDGGSNWRPGSAYFRDPRGGDQVLRGMLASGLLSDAKLQFLLAYDKVLDDDEMIGGDQTKNLSAALRFGHSGRLHGGLLWRYRTQHAEGSGELQSHILDIYLHHTHSFSDDVRVSLAFEGLLQEGSTSLRRFDAPRDRDLRAYGAALETNLDLGGYGVGLDAVFASGDKDSTDDKETNLTLDPNYQVGLIFFPHILAAQTGWLSVASSAARAANTLDEIPYREATHGGVSGASVLYPRAWWRVRDGLEVYGGLLMAWSADNNRIPSGFWSSSSAPENPLGGPPGDYLGTEIDLGIRYTMMLTGSTLGLGLEGGLFRFGSALKTAEGSRPENVGALRFLWTYRI